MTSNLIVINLVRINLIKSIYYILILVFPIIIALSSIPLTYILSTGLLLVVVSRFEKSSDPLIISQSGIPIAKVIWTKHWEEESRKIISRFPPQVSLREFNLFEIQMRFFVNNWDELHVKKINNSPSVLYNYNMIEPIIGVPVRASRMVYEP